MAFFYLFALLPLVVWGILLFISERRINVLEAILGSAAAFLLASGAQAFTVFMIPQDTETWSGYLTEATYYPAWTEYYEYEVDRTEYYQDTEYYTDSKGNSQSRTVTKSRQVFDHWEPTTANHGPSWSAEATYGTESAGYSLESWRYEDVKVKWRATPVAKKGDRSIWLHHNSRLLAGDPNDYEITPGAEAVFYPVTQVHHFENRLLGAPTLYRYEEVPQGTPVFPWPNNPDLWNSDRSLGTAAQVFPGTLWDQLNAQLGPQKKVNLIACGFMGTDATLGHLQEAAWRGGKKNDLVLCFGGPDPRNPTWAYVFGWTESAGVKRELEALLLQGKLSPLIFPEIAKIVSTRYVLKHFEKDFEYVSVQPPLWYYISYVVVLIVTQVILHVVFWKVTVELPKS